nr:hypothetical protein CFP56_35758 [Quercus suber]
MDSSKELVGNKSEKHIRDLLGGLVMTHEFRSVNMVNIPDKEKSATTTMKGNEPVQSDQPPHHAIWKPPPWPILKVNSNDAIFREQNSMDFVLDIGGGLVLFWRSTTDVIMEGSGTNYIDTMFQEEGRVEIGVIIQECQGKGLAHMVGIIPLPLTIIELETLVISKALQFDADLSLEDVTPKGVSEIAINALNANSQSLESFGLLSRDVKFFASLFHCIRFTHVHREGLLYYHIKRNNNGVAHSLKMHYAYQIFKYGWNMSHLILVRFYNWM